MATVTTAQAKPQVTGKAVLVFLLLLTLAGLATLVYRLGVGLGATTNLSDFYPWGLWIGFDFAMIAFSGGAFTLATIVHVFNLKKYRPILQLAVLTGWAGYMSVALILITDLGHWDRFWHFLVYPNLHSPMYEISWGLFLYSGVLTLELLPSLFKKLRRPKIVHLIHSVIVPLAIGGVIISTMHQSSLGTLYVAMPDRLNQLWYTPLMPLLFLISSVGVGLSAVILVSLAASRVFNWEIKINILEGLAKGSVGVWAVYLAFVLEHLLVGGLFSQAFSFNRASLLFLLEIFLMVILPLILYSIPSVRVNRKGLLVAGLSATLGTILNRFNVTFTAQSVGGIWTMPHLAETARYFPSWMEILIQVGVVSAAMLVWYFALRYLPILPRKRA